jgi:hypothetical protein
MNIGLKTIPRAHCNKQLNVEESLGNTFEEEQGNRVVESDSEKKRHRQAKSGLTTDLVQH